MKIPKKSNKKRLPQLQARIDKTRANAHKELVNAGKIQFRLDTKTMELLLQTADAKKTGAGVLARMWVVERLNKEIENNQNQQLQEIDKRLKQIENRLARRSAS